MKLDKIKSIADDFGWAIFHSQVSALTSAATLGTSVYLFAQDRAQLGLAFLACSGVYGRIVYKHRHGDQQEPKIFIRHP